MVIVAYVAGVATGLVLPPLFLILRERLERRALLRRGTTWGRR